MECLSLYFNKYLLLLFGFAITHNLQGQMSDTHPTNSNYYVYGESTPVLNDIGEIADYYNTSIEYLLEGGYSYTRSFRKRRIYFEDTLYSLRKDFLKEHPWIGKSVSYEVDSFLGKMIRHQYAHLFPLEEGDTLWLPLGSVNPIDRKEHFEAFDKLFKEKNTKAVRDSLVGTHFSFHFASIDTIGKISQELWECVADTTQDDAFVGGLADFKFDFNSEITAYLVKVESYKPYSGYLYLIRNSDKKLIREKPILVYYKNEATPCEYRTDTRVTDYNQDGHLDLIIYQKQYCFSSDGFRREEYSYRLLLWDKDNNDFVVEGEYKGNIKNTSELEKGFDEIEW